MKDESLPKHICIKLVGTVPHMRHSVTFVTFWFSKFQHSNSVAEFLCTTSRIHHQDHLLICCLVALQVINVFSFCLALWLSNLMFMLPRIVTFIIVYFLLWSCSIHYYTVLLSFVGVHCPICF